MGTWKKKSKGRGGLGEGEAAEKATGRRAVGVPRRGRVCDAGVGRPALGVERPTPGVGQLTPLHAGRWASHAGGWACDAGVRASHVGVRSSHAMVAPHAAGQASLAEG